ncbi:MAG: hypothetical protein ACI9XO_001376 [Paraglaciecola sp.]|jgi:hypothetical protein
MYLLLLALLGIIGVLRIVLNSIIYNTIHQASHDILAFQQIRKK